MTALQPLWQIEEHLTALLDTIDAAPEELLPEVQQQIAEYMQQSAAKVDQVAHVLAALEWEQKCAADEMARLQERKKRAAVAQERLEQYVCRVLKASGKKKLEGATNTLSVRAGDAVRITDAAAVPDGYKVATIKAPYHIWREVFAPFNFDGVTVSIDVAKAEIKKALKSGEDVPGADLDYRDNLVRK